MNRYASCLAFSDADLVWIVRRRRYIRAEEITIGSNRLLLTRPTENDGDGLPLVSQ
ncbi:MAG: hypothetical protein NZ744_02475 [Pirellulaceae bacterium]|nr:hypothetical protein [Pirellulaceae bacterium]